MDAATAIVALGALAQEHRLALFRLLVQAGDDGMAAGAIAEALDVPNSSLSFHLAQLSRAGLIRQTAAPLADLLGRLCRDERARRLSHGKLLRRRRVRRRRGLHRSPAQAKRKSA